MSVLLSDPQKILNTFTSALTEDEQAYTKAAVEMADAQQLEKPLDMTEREKCVYRMGVSQGLKRACTLMTHARNVCKNQMPANQTILL